VTTVVRPSEADLSAIARRIAGPLSPEGAENWYRKDTAVLLQEIATLRFEIMTLRREAETARQSFYQDGAQADMNDPLYVWAEAWKASATGFWQKAQTTTLREQLAAQRITAASLKESLTAAEDMNRAQAVETAALAAELAQLRQANDEIEQTHEAERSSYRRRIGDLEMQLKGRLARSRELLDRAMESL